MAGVVVGIGGASKMYVCMGLWCMIRVCAVSMVYSVLSSSGKGG